MIITGDFSESVCSANMKNFMNKTGLFRVFQEINGVKPKQREAEHEHRSKCIDHVLETEGMLRNITEI